MATFVTDALRGLVGQFVRVTDRLMIASGVERMGACGACGHKIRQHHGVRSPDGGLLWVGSTCVGILCAPDAPTVDVAPGTHYSDNGRELVVPTSEWVARLQSEAYAESTEKYIARVNRGGRGGRLVRNRFFASLCHTLEDYGQLTIGQYNAVCRTIGE